MRVFPEQLLTHLQKGLAPVYLLYGNELLFKKESQDLLFDYAQKNGYIERESLIVEANFDWNNLIAATKTLSLFSSKQLIELRIGNKSLGQAGSRVLKQYLSELPSDKLLVITIDKLEHAQLKSTWFKQLDQIGVTVPLKTPEGIQFHQWLGRRLSKSGLTLAPQATDLLVEYVEGNLLAAVQVLEKLVLTYGVTQINHEQLISCLADNARFNVFALVDSILQADVARTSKILKALHEDGTEPILVLWALTRELRLLIEITFQLEQGQALSAVLNQHRVWDARKQLVSNALRRRDAIQWQELLLYASQVDQQIKGVLPGNSWETLMILALRMMSKSRIHNKEKV